MSEPSSIWSQVAAMLVAASEKRFSPQDVRRETSLTDDLDLSSLMVVNLVVDLEQQFGITVADEDFDFKHLNVLTAGDVNDLIEAKLGKTVTKILTSQ
jgi:acyl carrier protein